MAAKNRKSLDEIITQLMARMSKTQQRALVTAGVLLVFLLVGLNNVIKPWQSKRRALENRYSEERKKADRMVDIRRQSEQLQEGEAVTLFQGGTPVLTSEISRLASAIGIQIESVAPQPQARFGPYIRSQIEVVATSNFSNLLMFLRALEEYEPRLMVDALEIQNLLGSEQNTVLQQISRGRQSGSGSETPEEKLLTSFLNEDRKSKLLISVFSKLGNRG